jgi:AbrB family looped-hinge helix DNA binding protein
MDRYRSTVTRKGQTTVPKAIREFLGLGESDPLYWEIADGNARVATEEPRFFRWFGAIKVGPGSTVDDVGQARRLRGR